MRAPEGTSRARTATGVPASDEKSHAGPVKLAQMVGGSLHAVLRAAAAGECRTARRRATAHRPFALLDPPDSLRQDGLIRRGRVLPADCELTVRGRDNSEGS